MKRMKKFASLLLALVMALALAVPAMAATGGGEDSAPELVSLTIENPLPGHRYGAFQIFTGTIGKETDNKLTMSNVEWGNAIATENNREGLASEVGVPTIEGQDVNSPAFAQKVAEAMQEKYGKDGAGLADIIVKYLTEDPQYQSTRVKKSEDADAHYIIKDMTPGYYLVKDMDPVSGNDTATDYILQVLNDESMKPKADGTPVVEKKINEGGNLRDTASVGIGDEVSFQLKATLPASVSVYKEYYLQFVDTLSKGLTLNENSITVKVIQPIKKTEDMTDKEYDDALLEALNAATPVAESAYEFATSATDDGGTKFTVTFDDVKKAPINAQGTELVVVEYKATLNSDAEIGFADGNPNEVELVYSNDPNHEGDGTPTGTTPKDTVIVFTYKLDNTKIDGNGDAPLANVKFILGKDADPTEGKKDDKTWAAVENDKIVNWNQTEDTATPLVSGADGTFSVAGLDAGTYYLREIETLDGYNKLTKDITIVITDDLKVIWNPSETPLNGENGFVYTIDNGEGTKNETGAVANEIKNFKGATLPETGGIGTTIFYVLGGLLTLGAVVLLVTKKRMSVEEK